MVPTFMLSIEKIFTQISFFCEQIINQYLDSKIGHDIQFLYSLLYSFKYPYSIIFDQFIMLHQIVLCPRIKTDIFCK